VSNESVVIVGAGPAGLAIGARLRHLGIPFRIFEAADIVGKKWMQHYDRLHLHTTKEHSYLPLTPFPKHFPTFISKHLFFSYLQDYHQRHELNAELNKPVLSVEKSEGGYLVSIEGEQLLTKFVVIASGLNHQPLLPFWVNNCPIPVIHASEYRNASQFGMKSALVVGFGNSGAEIALDLAENGIDTFCSIRNRVNIIPLRINGKPVQDAGKILEFLPFGWGDKIGRWISQRIIGDLTSYGIKSTTMTPAEQLKKIGRTPVVDVGTVDMIKDGNIKVKPDVSHVDGSVHFVDGSEQAVDLIICATGYGNGLGKILGSVGSFLNQSDDPPVIGADELRGMYFLGFDNHNVGGVLERIRIDSERIASDIQSQI